MSSCKPSTPESYDFTIMMTSHCELNGGWNIGGFLSLPNYIPRQKFWLYGISYYNILWWFRNHRVKKYDLRGWSEIHLEQTIASVYLHLQPPPAWSARVQVAMNSGVHAWIIYSVTLSAKNEDALGTWDGTVPHAGYSIIMLLIALLGNNFKHSDPNNKWGYYTLYLSLCTIATTFSPGHNNIIINVNNLLKS